MWSFGARPTGSTSILHSDNRLVFQSGRFRAACQQYRLRYEYIRPYTPEQNGMVECFFCSLKKECVWERNFGSVAAARRAVLRWIRWYGEERPH